MIPINTISELRYAHLKDNPDSRLGLIQDAYGVYMGLIQL